MPQPSGGPNPMRFQMPRSILPLLAGLALFAARPAEARITVNDFWPAYVESESDDHVLRDSEIAWPFWEEIRDATTTDRFNRPLWNNHEEESGDWFLHIVWPV